MARSANDDDRYDEHGDGGPATRQVPAVELIGDQAAARRRRRAVAPAEARTGEHPAAESSGAEDAGRPRPGGGANGAGAGGGPGDGGRRRSPLRYRVLPRSLLGITALILAFAVGAGLSGVVLYSYYQYKLNQTNDRVNTVVNGYKQQFANAEGDLKASAAAAKADIQAQLGPIQALEASPATLANLAKQLAPSVFFVHTLDANGQASVGSAFVISSNSTQSLLLTDYTTIAAATHNPAPDVFVRQGQTDTKVTVRTWDPSYDLALIVLPKGNLPVVPAAPATPAPQVGERLYAVSGLGSAGAALSQGLVTDVAASGIQHDAPLGAAYQGGPLVNQAGQVIAIGSRTYAPLGFASDSVWYAPYVQAACNKVLTCPGGSISGSQ